MNESDFKFKILKKLEKNPNLTQRQMAEELGVSLGKTNYLIKALLDMGFVKLRNFRKSDNKIGYMYLLTPNGVKEKTILAEQFLKRKSEEYARLKKEIESLQKQL